MPICVIASAHRRGSRPMSQAYPAIRMPIRMPAANCTYGRLSAPRFEMNFDRVIGLITLYADIARKEYANIISAVGPSSRRTSATGASSR